MEYNCIPVGVANTTESGEITAVVAIVEDTSEIGIVQGESHRGESSSVRQLTPAQCRTFWIHRTSCFRIFPPSPRTIPAPAVRCATNQTTMRYAVRRHFCRSTTDTTCSADGSLR